MERAQGHLETSIAMGIRHTPKDVCRIACQILAALHHLHKQNIIHRDVTLKNILRFPNGVKLSDFGISRSYVAPWDMARTFVGHPSYIAPELLTQGYSTAQSDLYQLGVVLLSLLMGKPPIPLHYTFAQADPLIRNAVPRLAAEALIPQFGQTAQMIAWLLPRTLRLRYKTAAQVYADFRAELNRLENATKKITPIAQVMMEALRNNAMRGSFSR